MGFEYDVFLSHSTAASDWSRRFAHQLRDRGLRVFYDEESVRPGALVEDAVRNGLRNSEAVVVVLDPSSSSSHWTAFELGAALGMGKAIVPIVSSKVPLDAVPPPLKTLQHVAMASPDEAAEQVVRILAPGSTGVR